MKVGWSRRFKIVAAICFFCICLSGTVFAATPYDANGRLAIINGQVVNAQGKEFVIKGVSTHGLAWYPDYVNKAAFQTLRDQWGVNTIRLALYSAEYGGYCTGGSQSSLKKLLDQGVAYATELGMYVIIDWHILSDGNPLTYKTQANTFFKEIAKKYAKYGNVMYEICNEPNGSGGTWKNIKSYAGTIIKTIRSVNSNAIIIVGTPTWSQDVDQAQASPITGYQNIAYTFHFYAATHQASMRTKLENTLKKGLPVIVTEFGISEASGSGSVSTASGNEWMKLLDRYKVGRVCWNLSNKSESCALLKSSCSKKSGWSSSDLTASGKWLITAYTGKSADSSTGSSGSTGGTTGGATSGTNSGSTGSGTGSTNSGSTGSGTGSTSNGSGSQSSTADKKSKTSTGKVKLKATLKRTGGWKSGKRNFTQYKLTIKNTGKKTSKGWKIIVKFKNSFSVSDKWCGSYKKSGRTITIKPLSWNKKLKKNGSTELGFILSSAKVETIQSIAVIAS